MDYSSPTPKTPVTQRRHASLFEVTHSSSAPIIPTMQRRLASRLFPTRKDSLPPSRKHLDSGTTEEMVLDHLKTGGSKRNSVAEHEFDEDKAANTTPDVVGARIDEDEASSASHIDWPAHHAQRARMFSKRTDSIPSAFKKSESYLELAEEDEDARNVMARVHAAHRRRTQGSFLQQTDLVQPTLKESDSYHESVGEQASSTTIEGGETPRGRRSPGLLPNDETGDEVTADLHPLASSTGDTSSDECSHDLAEEDFPSLARRIRDTNNRKTKPDSFNVRVIATPNSDKTIYDEEHRILTGIHFIVKGKLISRSKPCRCGSGRKFKKCCGLVIRTEAEELYGDLDALARRIGFVAIDLENSTRKSYAQRDAEEEAKGTAQEEESMATAQEEGSEDNEDNEDTVGGYNITYTAGGRPLAPNEPCLCLSENKFKDCCMPKLNKQAERDHGEILEELQRQGRTVNLVLEIEDPDKAKSPESDTTIGPTDRADTEEREFVAAHPGPDSFSMRHVSFPPLPQPLSRPIPYATLSNLPSPGLRRPTQPRVARTIHIPRRPLPQLGPPLADPIHRRSNRAPNERRRPSRPPHLHPSAEFVHDRGSSRKLG